MCYYQPEVRARPNVITMTLNWWSVQYNTGLYRSYIITVRYFFEVNSQEKFLTNSSPEYQQLVLVGNIIKIIINIIRKHYFLLYLIVHMSNICSSHPIHASKFDTIHMYGMKEEAIGKQFQLLILHPFSKKWYMDTQVYTRYCTWEIFGGGKFWRTMQVKAIGEENFGQIHQFLTHQNFLCTVQ